MMAPFVLALAALFVPPQEKKADSPFLEREVQVEGKAYKYRVYVPPDRKEGEKLPAILFLHGAGEAGSDNRQQTGTGIGPEIVEHPERVRAVVVMPQCERRSYWQGIAETRALAA